jgi:hypothetical protein
MSAKNVMRPNFTKLVPMTASTAQLDDLLISNPFLPMLRLSQF